MPLSAPKQPAHAVTVADRLRTGEVVLDADFDHVFPPDVRRFSTPFWTPVHVAVRAASLLAPTPRARVLDVGAGPGKFCIVGALSTGASFDGVEHRAYLVEVASAASARYGATRARFVCDVFDALDPRDYDGFYLFNPFEENLWDPHRRPDESVHLSPARYMADVLAARRFLGAARRGSRVVTYHGFGGSPPRPFQRVLRERCGSAHLDLWEAR